MCRVLLTLLLIFPAICLSQSQSEWDSQVQQAEQEFLKGDFEGSMKVFQEALKHYEYLGDRQRTADILFRMGRAYRRMARFSEAEQLLNRAQQLHTELGDQKGLGFDITEIAVAKQRQGEYDQSIALSEKALAIHEAAKNPNGIARTLENFGNIYFRKDEFPKAIEYFERAQLLAEENGNKGLLAIILSNLGVVYKYQGNIPKALECYDEAQLLSEEVGDLLLLGAIYGNRTLVHLDSGDTMQGLNDLQRLRVIFHETGNQQFEATTYLNIANVQLELGSYGKSHETLQRALTMAEDLKDKGLTATILSSLAQLHYELGNYDTALDDIQRSTNAFREIGEKRGVALDLLYIGAIYERQNKYSLALDQYRKANLIYTEVGNQHGVALSLHVAGIAYSKLGNHQRALKSYQQALAIRELIGNKNAMGSSYLMIGSAYRSLGKLVEAEAALDKSIEILREVGQVESFWPALYQKGLICLENGKTEEALSWMKESVRVIEQVRSEVGVAEFKSTYLENKVDVYESLIQIVVDSGDIPAAFEYVQKSKARAFLDLLSESRMDPKSDLSTDLHEKKKKILAELTNLNRKIREEFEKDQVNPATVRTLESKRNRVDEEYLNTLMEIRNKNPRYADLQYPQPLQLSQAQELLDSETVLLDYFIGKNKSLLFLITALDVKVFHLEGEQRLSAQVRELLEAIQNPEAVWEVSHSYHTRYVQMASSLYRKILAPAGFALKGKRRMIIAADGPLNYLAFEALLTSQNSNVEINFSKLPYLALNYEIQYVPSISVLAAIGTAKNNVSTDRKELIAFAVPVTETNPVSVKKSTMADPSLPFFSSSLPKLNYAKVEAEGICNLYPKGKSSLLLGREASERNVKSLNLSEYRIVHFASHGLIDEEHPQFSALVLNSDMDEDGYLTMREVFDLTLNSDLVVLSACKSASGQQVRGEGIAGLSRAFLGAGSASVLVSLWGVYDRSTVDFMTSFYQRLSRGELNKARALKDARLAMIRSKSFSHPYYWAPFILIGNN